MLSTRINPYIRAGIPERAKQPAFGGVNSSKGLKFFYSSFARAPQSQGSYKKWARRVYRDPFLTNEQKRDITYRLKGLVRKFSQGKRRKEQLAALGQIEYRLETVVNKQRKQGLSASA